MHPVLQLLSTIIALFGFNGYDTPREHVKACEFCRMSGGGRNAFFVTLNAPQAGTEAYCTDSIIGCLYVPAPLPSLLLSSQEADDIPVAAV